MSNPELAGGDAAGEPRGRRQCDDAADAERCSALPALALLIVVGGDAGPPVGGKTGMGKIGDRRQQAG